MGGSKGTPGVTPQITNEVTGVEEGLVNLANTQVAQAGQLFNLTEPGLATAENQYEALATGDPGTIMRAIAPQAQQISQATAGAKANIMANAPAGGEKNLALEMTDVNRGAAIGNAASGAVQSSYQSLGNLAGQTIPEALGAESGASGSLSGAGNQALGLGGLQLQGQQLQMEQKGQELGAFGGLAGDAAQLGGSFMGKQGSEAIAGALAV